MSRVDEVEEIDIDKLEAEPGVEDASTSATVSSWLPGKPEAGIDRGC